MQFHPWRTILFVVWLSAVCCPAALCGQQESKRAGQSAGDGFVPLFDGKTLAGWHAVPKASASDWTVRDGVIVGLGSADRLSYLVWKDEHLTDFELKLSYRLPKKGNTGVEIRCQPDRTHKRPFEGYHADLGHVGIGPHILGAWDFHFARRKEYPCRRGTRLVIDADGKAHSSTIRGAVTLTDIRRRQWNDVHIIARGRNFKFFINGKLSSEFTDNAKQGRLDQGAIGLQIHDKGMHVEFKDIRLKRLTSVSQSPKPLPVGLRKQLLIDDALIHRRHGVVRRVQPATKMKKPVLTPERPWEFSYLGESGDPGIGKRIYVYGTVFYDPLQKQYRMWYMSRMSRGHKYAIPELKIPGGGNRHCDLTLYASSKDGIRWERPNLGLVRFNGSRKNNIMLDFHGASVFLDQEESDPKKRYKAIGYIRRYHEIRMCHSADGIHWSDPQHAGGRNNEGSFNACYVPSLRCYVAGSIERSSDARYEFKNWQGRRGRKRVIATLRTEGKDLRRWEKKTFIYPDDKDDPNTQFYGMTPFVYGDLVLGFLHVFHYKGPGPGNDDGPIDVQLVYSRDGRTWHRLEDRRPVISPGRKGSFDGGMIMMTANGAFARGDELIAYYTAANTTHGALVKDKFFTIGRVSWRRDRLVALQAKHKPGTVVTKPFKLEGDTLQVNVDAVAGYVKVELLDATGKPIPGFSGKAAKQHKGADELRLRPQWKSGGDLSRLKGKTVKLRFTLQNAKLYSFSFSD